MDRTRFYNQENVEADDMNTLYDDIEQVMKQHLMDFHATETLGKILSGMSITEDITPSLDIVILEGTAYINYQRVDVASNQTITVSNVPTGGAAIDIRRIDLICIKFNRLASTPLTRRFMDVNGNVIESTINTELYDYFTISYIEGTESASPVVPDTPANYLPLAQVYLRRNAIAVYSTDQGTALTGYFVDVAPR